MKIGDLVRVKVPVNFSDECASRWYECRDGIVVGPAKLVIRQGTAHYGPGRIWLLPVLAGGQVFQIDKDKVKFLSRGQNESR